MSTLRASMSQNYLTCVFSTVPVWRCATSSLEKNKPSNMANREYQTRILFLCSNSTLTCSL